MCYNFEIKYFSLLVVVYLGFVNLNAFSGQIGSKQIGMNQPYIN